MTSSKLSGRQWAGAIISALLLFLASPGLYEFSPLAWLALVPLMTALLRPSIRPAQAARLGLATGMIYYSLLLYWILIVLGRYGHLQLWVTLPALVLLALYMSLYLVIFSVLTGRLGQTAGLVWLAPTFWVGLDWLRSRLFTGFPWLDLGYTQYRHPHLIQVADLVGHHGVTFLIVMVNTLLALSLRSHKGNLFRPTRPGPVLTFALIFLVLAAGYDLVAFARVQSEINVSDTFKVAVVQGNIDQGEKWRPGTRKETMDKYLQLTERELPTHPDLVVWPETAMPFYLRESNFLIRLETMAVTAGTDLLTGAPFREVDPDDHITRYYNSSFLINDRGVVVGRYDKEHLVPFGEYVPLRRLLYFLGPLVESVGDFSPGAALRPIPCKNTAVGVLICFESIFPELARRQTDAGAGLLVNLTNDAWYGRSSAPWQSIAMTVFRAVENRRSLARAANTGVSGFIDPLGRLLEVSPLFEEYTASQVLPLLRSKTFFDRYGYLAGPLCLALTALSAALLLFRKR